jgi:hypothetical protein
VLCWQQHQFAAAGFQIMRQGYRVCAAPTVSLQHCSVEAQQVVLAMGGASVADWKKCWGLM